MADQSDVETVLVALVAAALYPGGAAADSICGQPARIYRGWPNPPSLDADLASSVLHATVMSVDGTIRNITRYPDAWLSDPPAPTLLVSVVGNIVTFGGSADEGQLAGIAADGKTYVYRTGPSDTAAAVAANLASLARSGSVVRLSGTTVTLLTASDVIARIAADNTARMEVRRQTQRFRIAIWCNAPAVRDSAATAIDLALAPRRFVALSDGSQGRVSFGGGATLDRSENASLYRRDLLYDIEYPTTLLAEQPTMLFGTGMVNSTSIIG